MGSVVGMKKVRIVTIISYNMGNRLQNLALTRILQNLGCEVKTIPSRKNYKRRKMVKMLIKPILGKANNWEKFERKISYDRKLANNINVDKIDYFIAGSDQIWNPLFPFNTSREYLEFARPEQRIAYAASIGLDSFPQDKQEEFRREIKKFKAISVREQSAVDIVKEVANRDAELVVDPVMLLSTDEWNNEIGNDNHLIDKKYSVVYYLGNGNKELINEIISKVSEKGLAIVDIMDINGKKSGFVGPFEFIRLIRDSEFVITDSFHATVFSIMYHKPFVTLRGTESKADMNTRLKSILKMFGFENRYISSKDDIDVVDSKCDFSKVDSILALERKKAISFLSTALECK